MCGVATAEYWCGWLVDAKGFEDGVLKAVEGVLLITLGVKVASNRDIDDATGRDIWR